MKETYNMRQEYPRPQFERNSWINLNGFWEFEFDYEGEGLEKRWYEEGHSFSKKIEVPYVYQSKKSGLSEEPESEVVWYKKTVEINDISKRTIIHFGAVDYETDLYVNGEHAGNHVGGHTSFNFDITHLVTEGENELTVRVRDYFTNEWIPRGKQFWEEKPRSIWYRNTTGIWQPVWIEQVNNYHLEKVYITPDLDTHSVQFKPVANDMTDNMYLNIRITYENELVTDNTVLLKANRTTYTFDVFDGKVMSAHHGPGRTWSPEHPNLFDVTFKLYVENDLVDEVESYFGMRKVHIENGQIYLNNRPYYQKLALDQGYWPDTLMTAETDEDFITDIKLAKAMGLNGVRKHQKVEDPRFLYHADRMGFLVWGESAAAPSFDEHAVGLLINEWDEIIERDYNHPSVVAWTPLNESWGVPEINYNKKQQHFAQTMYHFIKSQDQTRLVVVNDGWEMIETDIIGIHNYGHGDEGDTIKNKQYEEDLSSTENLISAVHNNGKNVIVDGFEYEGQPILLTEFGGISYNPETVEEDAWGYTSTNSAEKFMDSYRRIMETVYNSEAINGFCYTQLTDVFQETNGYVTFDREPKVPLDEIKKINDMRY